MKKQVTIRSMAGRQVAKVHLPNYFSSVFITFTDGTFVAFKHEQGYDGDPGEIGELRITHDNIHEHRLALVDAEIITDKEGKKFDDEWSSERLRRQQARDVKELARLKKQYPDQA
jgi:hypothetical protein